MQPGATTESASPGAPATTVPGRRGRLLLAGTVALGLILLMVPVLALFLTNRDPDPLFLGYWWSPIASIPTDTLAIGTLGLTLLLAAALALVVTAPLRRPAVRRLLAVGVAAAAVGAGFAGYGVAASARSDTSSAAIRAVLLRQAPSSEVSGRARRAFELALGWPASTPTGIRVLPRGSVPAGPWLVQTTRVLNQNLSDEGSDVEVGTLVDPVTGAVEAAWFSGL